MASNSRFYSKNKNIRTLPKKDDSEPEEFFCKHYVESRKANLKVYFDDKCHVKPPTIVTSILMSTLERDEIEIRNCKTDEEIKEIGDELMKELEELQEKKQKGYDIYQQYEDLKYKFELAKEMKQKMNGGKTFHGGHTRAMKAFNVAPITWSESSFRKYKATICTPIKPMNVDDVKEKVRYNSTDLSVMIANQPFDKGSLRFAFAAFIIDPSTGVKRKYVAKESMFNDPKYNTREYYEDIVENQVIATYLADEFFKISKSEKSVRFLEVSLIHIKETGKYYSLEEFIESDFIKWTNNAGYVNEETYASTLNAFSHWTYQITSEYLVVADLQGFVKNGNEYVLTDPAIECPDGLLRFTSTNLGIDGVKKFFESHQCNPICKYLRLKKHKCQKLPDKTSAATKITN